MAIIRYSNLPDHYFDHKGNIFEDHDNDIERTQFSPVGDQPLGGDSMYEYSIRSINPRDRKFTKGSYSLITDSFKNLRAKYPYIFKPEAKRCTITKHQ